MVPLFTKETILCTTYAKECPMLVKIVSVLSLVCYFFFLPAITLAEQDPVIQTIEEALAEYKKQNYSAAATNLEYASQLIRQKKGETLAAFLPQPMDGWTADEGKSQVSTASLLGGGLTAERNYSKTDATITITIVTDSPLLQPMIMMFSNPIFASSAGRFELIKGYKGIVKYQNSGGDINIVINNRFLATIKGKQVTEKELLDYANSIDLKGIAELP